MSSIFSNDLANGDDFMARDNFFTEFYKTANLYEDAQSEDNTTALIVFLKRNVDSIDLLDLINYNIATAAYPRTRELVANIRPLLVQICEHRKMLALLTA
jgi:hypothetical protein